MKDIICKLAVPPLGVALTGLATFSSCGDGAGTREHGVTAMPPFSGHADFERFYPQLAQSGFVPKSFEVFSGAAVPTAVYNYTSSNIDYETTRKVYEFLDSRKWSVTFRNEVSINGQTVKMAYFGKRAGSRVMAFVPKFAPRPDWSDAGLDTRWHEGATRIQTDGRVISYVRDVTSPNPDIQIETTKRQLTEGFAVEACQQTLSARFMDQGQALLNDEFNTLFAQELWCNSFGLAIGAKILGYSYKDYVNVAVREKISILNKISDFPLLVLSQASFDQLPHFGPLIKVTK